MFSETSFVSKQPELKPNLVSSLSKTKRLFRLFRFYIEKGSFGVSKQTKDKPKQQQICKNINLFNAPYHKFYLFWLFRYRSGTPTKPKKFALVSWKNKPKNNRNRLSFGLFRFEPRKKINCFEDPLIEKVYWRFFRFVSVCFDKVLFVSVVSIPVRNTKANRKKCFLVSWNKPKNNQNRLSFGSKRPKNLIVSRTPYPRVMWRIFLVTKTASLTKVWRR